ncbi:CDP-diacylglycerol--glycerol-3-phosphate 3-phosphatidyltransferase [Microsporum canis]|uniref:CDP-diacylglycerol--glycerol-3-phosphate 3-phosphatidyltransferase n=1 Tax=Arthroderma otae (strain ATCC MYA-4605 / CBS 113480) TaxID=554155 RepID=C5FVY9_ARTOC|nr:CDP-diacylglycerol-glycerol-3-phosphate 3-phosphatidyltransferase [Microsporum canis CBS 113480]EEQ34073.1 CDP-diacylglycerol-glycerol-3-phosphate 3-phosphatidyltransferase [Microsporum canis CBS 113480]
MIKRIGGRTLQNCCRGCSARNTNYTSPIRRYSSTSAPAASYTSVSSPIGSLTVELDRIAPKFKVQASNIQILNSPAAFYETLKDKIRNAKRRVYLSTLYIGKTEHELLSVLNESLRQNPDLKVSILTDALRGTRESPNSSCASLLASLVEEHGPERVEIRMFHTPNLVGMKKKYVPKRINEGWGLQHMKLYGVDDEIILSGANLSNDYFTNRLDRYHVFQSTELAEYYSQIHHAICKFSFQVLPDTKSKQGYVLSWPATNAAPSPLDDPEDFISVASTALSILIQPPKGQDISASMPDNQTYVYPVAQFTPILKPDQSTEFPAVTSILGSLANNPTLKNSRWLFTAGYFNMHPVLSSLLISSTTPSPGSPRNQGTVLTASPWANGFYGSPGVSGMLPAAYTHLSARFLDRVAEAQRTNSIQLKEWRKGTVNEPNGWTYHAKGLWVTLPDEKYPSLTFVGSSNYTKRSYGLDLEVGAVVVTTDNNLKERLGQETEWLQEDSKPVSREDLRMVERRVSWNVRLAMWIVERVGGAL